MFFSQFLVNLAGKTRSAGSRLSEGGEIGQEAKFEICFGYLKFLEKVSLPIFLWGGRNMVTDQNYTDDFSFLSEQT